MQLRHILLIAGGAVVALAIGVGVGTLARVPVDDALAGGGAVAPPTGQTTAEVIGAPAPPAPVLDIDPLSYSAEPPMAAPVAPTSPPAAPIAAAPVAAAPANTAAREYERPLAHDDGPREVSAPPPTDDDSPG